ncbi:MAG: glycerol-3-phosphate 1-O-acyltransferase PlsY [Pelagibacterales bacterium]|nr:glycerol-3-phosphate 1-O-acyltransferase PlsY [Pelagibacterales bacterium]
MIVEVLLVISLSYILGSIPSGIIFTKIFKLKDLRTIGSGNTGTTNVLRTGNYTAAALTLILDFGKACLAIYLSQIVNEKLILISSLFILIGHIFPLWLKFKGGKGFACYLGIIFMINLYLFIFISLIWLITFFAKRISSLSALLSCLSGVLISIIYFNSNIVLVVLLTILIFVTHLENIKRLINGTETKIK